MDHCENLLLLPGLLCDAQLWADQVVNLSDVAACTFADMTLDDNIGAMAARALAAAPPKFALSGLSLGGYVAFEIMRRAPERVTRLALFATTAAPDSAQRKDERRSAMVSLGSGRFLGVSARMLSRLIHPDRVGQPIGAAVREMARRVGREVFLRQQQAVLNRPNSLPALTSIAVPTMIVVGEQDVLTPAEDARAMHNAISRSSLHLLSHCGHLPPMERPAATSRLLREWLMGANDV